MNEATIDISPQQLSEIPIEQVSAQQVSVDVAHKDAQLIRIVDEQGKPFSWEQIAHALINSADFRQWWNTIWADLPFDFEWKPIPIHDYTAKTHPFFVIVFPSEFRAADSSDFQNYLNGMKRESLTACFPNFSGDAHLLIPRETGEYSHIAAFCRTAPDAAMQALWERVGVLCAEAIAQRTPIWCNTHGHGVPWLHIRFDKRLKYASFPPRGSISTHSQAIWYQKIYQVAVG